MEPTNGSDRAGIRSPSTGANGFEVALTWHDNIVVLGASGTLDVVTTPHLTESIHSALKHRPAAVIVDLARVEFLAVAGMTALITAQKQIGESAQFAVVADGPATGRPMRLVGVDKLLTIHTTLDAALEASALNKPEPPTG